MFTQILVQILAILVLVVAFVFAVAIVSLLIKLGLRIADWLLGVLNS